MRKTRKRFILALTILVVSVILLPFTTIGSAYGNQTFQELVEESGYDLSWWNVGSGGAISGNSSGYSLRGVMGQPDAALWSGGEYTLQGGFWNGTAVQYCVNLPLILRE